jgi:Cys-tRNA(Pro)/Cys-tRNA(Cys) deacylase
MPVRKTQAMRLLEAKRISYTASIYDDAEAFHSAEEAAAILGVRLTAMYKTLVVLRETTAKSKALLVMVPSDSELDLKLLAASLGEKKLRMSSQKEAERLTGLQVGGISVLALRNPGAFEVLIDERARDLETIHISAGERGIEIALKTSDLVAVSGARFVRATH